jgi:hypothetical protein
MLGDHAAAELALIGAPSVIKDPLIDIVNTFAAVSDAEINWPLMRNYLDKLLVAQPLTALTSNPAEWQKTSLGGEDTLWQSKRWPEAWTRDPALGSYALISEITAGGTVVMHQTIPG